MIGALGNFFIGERIFKVILQLSIENENIAATNARNFIQGAEPSLVSMW